MFWKYNTTSSSQIDTLLAEEGVTLHEVMESEDIISECRAQNKNLIDFLLRPEVIEELVILTTKEPSIILSESIRFKYPNIASELLTCDVPAINERLAGDKSLLEKLYEFLENEPPLNPLLASYFSKIIGGLVAKKTEQNWLSYQLTCLQVLDFLKGKDTFLPLLLKHLGTSAIMDLMLKLMTQDEGVEMRQNILNWLDSQNIIQQLVGLLSPEVEKERHDNVAQLLCDFLVTARENQRIFDPDPLLKTLESPETIKLLLDQLFEHENEKCESSIVGGISVLMSLFHSNPPSWMGFRTTKFLNESYDANINKEAADLEHKQTVRRNIVEAVTPRLKDFHDLLLNPPKKFPVLTTVGLLDPPLGNARLQVVRLLAVLTSSNSDQLHSQLISLGTFQVLLDLFFKYPFNNFLHTQVENCLLAALEVGRGEEGNKENQITPLCKHLIGACNLVETIMKAWKENDKQQSENKAIRQGYMGHLISLINYIVKLTQDTQLGDQLKELKPDTFATLEEFKAAQLVEVMEKQEKVLGGVHPNALIEDNDDFDDIPFPQSNALQQQMQNLPSIIDGYSGFNDDAFNDGDETLQTIDNQSDVNFDLSEVEMMQRDAIFKQLCAQSINTLFDADDTVFEERDHTFQTVIEKKDQADGAENSSDSDDERPSGGDENMEVDPWTSPKMDPWGSGSASENATNWADFSSATFEASSSALKANFPETTPELPATSSVGADKTASSGDTLENTAASGDHPHNEEKPAEKQSCSSQLPPSISVEGDACKTPTEKSPGKPPTTDKQENV